MPIFLKTEDEIEDIRQANILVANTLEMLSELIAPGVSTGYLDYVAEQYICSRGGIPAFKHELNSVGVAFPGAICTSVNQVVVHGIPSQSVILCEGDIISIDCGVLLNGFYGDACRTFSVGSISGHAERLMTVCEAALYKGIEQAKPGYHLGDVGWAIEQHVSAEGFHVLKPLTGHGIGKELHEEPRIPNYGKCSSGIMLKVGMVLAIEPIIAECESSLFLQADGWTVCSARQCLSTHFEHTIAIRSDGAEILSLSQCEK